MKGKRISAVLIIAMSLVVLVGVAYAAQDRSTLKALDGIGFYDFKGYEGWQDVAVSQTDGEIKAILANPVVMANLTLTRRPACSRLTETTPHSGRPFVTGAIRW
jgi:hypothetical protein